MASKIIPPKEGRIDPQPHMNPLTILPHIETSKKITYIIKL